LRQGSQNCEKGAPFFDFILAGDAVVQVRFEHNALSVTEDALDEALQLFRVRMQDRIAHHGNSKFATA
jgi:hypothetical protein